MHAWRQPAAPAVTRSSRHAVMGYCAVWFCAGMQRLVTCGAMPACAHRLRPSDALLAHSLPPVPGALACI